MTTATTYTAECSMSFGQGLRNTKSVTRVTILTRQITPRTEGCSVLEISAGPALLNYGFGLKLLTRSITRLAFKAFTRKLVRAISARIVWIAFSSSRSKETAQPSTALTKAAPLFDTAADADGFKVLITT